MDNQTPSTSNDTDNDPADYTVTHNENDKIDTLDYLDALLGAAIKRQQAKQEAKQKRALTHGGIGEGTGQLIDLAALNLFDVPYYVDPNQPITLPEESD